MKPNKLLRLAALLAMLAFVGITANAQLYLAGPLGSPGFRGSIVTNGDSTITVVGGGNDLWNNSDNGYFYYTWAEGPTWDAQVKVNGLSPGSAYADTLWIKAEMMVRWSDTAVGVQGSDGFIASMEAVNQGTPQGAQYRPSRAAGANNVGGVSSSFPLPAWLRVTRTNNVFTTWASPDGATWTVLQAIDTTVAANGFGAVWPDLLTVGVAVTAHVNTDNGDPTQTATANFDQPTLTGSPYAAPTAIGMGTPVQDVTTHAGFEAAFTCNATNNGTPQALFGSATTYQWYKNGVAVPGLTRQHYTFLTQPGDNGATVSCVAQLIPPWNSLVVTSTAHMTITDDALWTNGVKLEIFAGVTAKDDVIADNTGSGDTGNVSVPGKLVWKPAYEDGGGYGNDTSRRYSAWFKPAADGNYTFYIAADDDSYLLLSTDANPANKRKIAQEMAWAGFNVWTNDQGGGPDIYDPTNHWLIDQKCSDTWTNGDGIGTMPWAGGIPLTGGSLYYLELVEHNGGGGDNASATAKLFADSPPTNGTPSIFNTANGNILMRTLPVPANPFVFSVQPTNTSVSENQGVTFYALATSPSEFRPNYQWQRGGVDIGGATRTSYNIGLTVAADNGATFALVASLPGGQTITSQVATLTVITAVFEPGFVLNQRWNGVNDWTQARDGTLGVPTYMAVVPALEAAVDNPSSGNMVNYTRKLSGFFIPPTNGRYVFFANSDDNSAFFISTDSDPANKYQITHETAWSNPWQWTSPSGNGGNAFDKRSDQYTNTAGIVPGAGGIPLTAGQKYYIEDDAGQGGGGGNTEVTYKLLADPDPANGTDTIMVTNRIGINAPKANWVRFDSQPTNPPPVGAGSLSTANFYATGSSDSTLAVGSVRSVVINGNADELTGQTVFFQWYRNGTQPIAGATATQLTLTGLRPSDNGAQFMCQMRALGYGLAPNTRYWSNSLTATLTVTNDPTVPALLFSGQYYNDNQIPAATFISLTFNAPMDPTQLTNPASYTVAGANVVAVHVSADNRRVQLQLDAAPAFPALVTFTGLRSWSQVALSTPSVSVSASALPPGLTFRDIGVQNANDPTIIDPQFPSRLWAEGPGVYTVAAEGSDIWNNNDGFNFLYEQKTGNFDVVVRQLNYGVSSPWAKFGLMVREPYGPGQIDDHLTVSVPGDAGASRNWNVINDPPAVPVNGGTGANTVEAGYRFVKGTNTAIWWPSPPNYLLTVTPAHPGNAWLRLKRSGSEVGGGQTLTAYAGDDGHTWFKVAETVVTSNTNNTTPIPSDMYVGICTTGHGNDPIGTPELNLLQYNYSTFDNYNSSYAGGSVPVAPTLTIVLRGTNVVVSWTPVGGELQTSTDLRNWTSVWFTNPHTNAATSGDLYYRVVTQYNP